MNILFCDNALDHKTVDPDFADEFEAARANGFTNHLFSFETLTQDKDAISAIRRIKPGDSVQTIIYRGWMLKPFQYSLLYEALLSKNYQLINSPAEYQRCHYLPDSYRFIEAHTPKTVWITVNQQQVDYDKIFKGIGIFGDTPLIVKDFVKSQKHYWETACFIPSAANKEKVRSVIEKFVELQGSDLNEGIVIRQFIPLQELTIHSKSGMPLKLEYRLFFLHGQLLGCYDYWEEGEYVAEEPPLGLFTKIAQGIESHFFSMDIAKAQSGDWVIIELGDGQVAGLPDSVDKNAFYRLVEDKV